MTRFTTRTALLSGAALMAALAAAPAAYAQAQYDFNLPSQSLGDSLKAVAHRAGVNVAFDPASVAGKTAPALKGTYSPEGAVRALIEGSGLGLKVTSGGSLVVVGGEGEASSPAPATAVQEVVVTGTHIHGGTSASPLIVIDRDGIERSGYSTTDEVIRSITENFGGGVSPLGTLSSPGLQNSENFTGASAVNLRGLGQDATVTLIDGHRFAYDGAFNAVDSSVIPLIAIQRIDVLTDGASAVYGSDAVAGVVNFILRKDYDGAETSALVGGATEGGDRQLQLQQVVGHVWGSGSALIAYEYLDQTGVDASQRDFTSGAATPNTLVMPITKNAVFATVTQQLAENVSFDAEAIYDHRSSDSSTNFFGYTTYLPTTASQYAVSADVSTKVLGAWNVKLSGTASEDDNKTISRSVDPFGNTTYDDLFNYNSLQTLELGADGVLFTLPSGTVTAAVGAGVRHEGLTRQYDSNFSASRTISYGYGELRVPLVTEDTARIGLQSAVLTASGRYETYGGRDASTDPKVGLAVKPISGLTLRGTWSTSFRNPSLLDQYTATTGTVFPASLLGIPSVPSGANALIIQGGNADLKPETSSAWTAGFDYTPNQSFKFSGTVFHIAYHNRITTPFGIAVGIYDDPTYAPYIIKSPSTALSQQTLASLSQVTNFGGGAIDPASIVAIYNDQSTNAYRQDVSGADLSGQYVADLAGGEFRAGASASWLDIRQQDTPTVPYRTISGFVFEPPSFHGRLTASWERDGWAFNVAANYLSSEVDNASIYSAYGAPQTDAHVSSWTTLDAVIAYRFGAESGLLKRTRVTLSALNLLDQHPPMLADSVLTPGLNYDATNTSPVGRFVSLGIVCDW